LRREFPFKFAIRCVGPMPYGGDFLPIIVPGPDQWASANLSADGLGR